MVTQERDVTIYIGRNLFVRGFGSGKSLKDNGIISIMMVPIAKMESLVVTAVVVCVPNTYTLMPMAPSASFH